MNAKNYDLLFNEDVEETMCITWTSEDGISFDLAIIATIEIEESGKEYVAAIPTEPNEEFEEGTVLFLIYSEDTDGNPEFAPIEDEDELELVGTAFEQFFEDEDDEDEEEIDEEDYLNDISDLFPGVSIKRD